MCFRFPSSLRYMHGVSSVYVDGVRNVYKGRDACRPPSSDDGDYFTLDIYFFSIGAVCIQFTVSFIHFFSIPFSIVFTCLMSERSETCCTVKCKHHCNIAWKLVGDRRCILPHNKLFISIRKAATFSNVTYRLQSMYFRKIAYTLLSASVQTFGTFLHRYCFCCSVLHKFTAHKQDRKTHHKQSGETVETLISI